MTSLADYFSLWTRSAPPASAAQAFPIERLRQPAFFLGVFAGAVSSFVFNHYRSGASLDSSALVLSLIASAVTFPLVYERAGLAQAEFFWEIVIDLARATIPSAGG
ncbi:MAG TPA: hypothetical protein VMR86_14595 [Myxococcota bacterium]|nr:hypothetical protein [Myxococcota bacterium]